MSEHIVSPKIYIAIFFALLFGTWATVAVAGVDLGAMNLPVALLIATAKATLVVLFFMHVKYSARLTKLFVVSGFVWLAILLVITFSDYLSRGWLGYPGT